MRAVTLHPRGVELVPHAPPTCRLGSNKFALSHIHSTYLLIRDFLNLQTSESLVTPVDHEIMPHFRQPEQDAHDSGAFHPQYHPRLARETVPHNSDVAIPSAKNGYQAIASMADCAASPVDHLAIPDSHPIDVSGIADLEYILINRDGEDETANAAQPPAPRHYVGASKRKITNGVAKRSSRERPTRIRSLSQGCPRPPPGKDSDDDDGEGEDIDVDSGRDTQGHRNTGEQKRCFACPMYKYDKAQHKSCSRLQLTRVRDVKQHLLRRHRRGIYCPICKKLFADEISRDVHTNKLACMEPPGGVSITGITDKQKNSLSRRVNRSLNEIEQWNSIWDILFPESPRPGSPYVANKLVEAIDMISDCWQRQGSAFIQELIEAKHGDANFDRRLLAASSEISELVEGLLGRVRGTLLDPNSVDPTVQEHIPTVPSRLHQPQEETRTNHIVSFTNSLGTLDHNHLLSPSDDIAPLSYLGGSSAATLHGGAFADASLPRLSLQEDLCLDQSLQSSLSSLMSDVSPSMLSWTSSGDQLLATSPDQWNQEGMRGFGEAETLSFEFGEFCTESAPYDMDSEMAQ